MPAEAGAVRHVPAREVDERVLHLDALDVGDAPGRDVHVAAGVDAVAVRSGAEAAAVHVVEPLGVGQPLAVVAAVHEARSSRVPGAEPAGVDVVLPSGGVEHLGEALADRGHEHPADHGGEAAGSGKGAVQDRALRHPHADRRQLAVVPGDVPEELVGERDVQVRHGAGQGRIGVPGGLRTGAVEVDVQGIALLGDGAHHGEDVGVGLVGLARRVVDARAPDAVGQRAQLGARHLLGVSQRLLPRRLDELQAELVHQAEIAGGADVVASDHRLDVQPHVLGVAALLGEGAEHVLPELAPFHHLDAQDADALVEDLQGGAPQHAAGIGGVGAGGDPGDQAPVQEDRLDHHHVVGVGPGHVGIVEEELVAVVKARRFAVPFDEVLDGVRGGGGEAQMAGAGQHHLALAVVERAHDLAALGHDG